MYPVMKWEVKECNGGELLPAVVGILDVGGLVSDIQNV